MKYTLSRFTVAPEKIREARRALAGLVAAVREHEPKTLFLVFRADVPNVFILLMSFENEAAERRHAQSRYVSQFARKLLPLCEGKPSFSELSLFVTSRKQWVLEAVQAMNRAPEASASPVHRRFPQRARRLRVKTPADSPD